jgi:Protein of unknown function (DUF3223)
VASVSELRCQMGEAKLPRGWKTAATKLCQQITADHEDGAPIEGAELAFLRDLLERHPCAAEKKGSGITAITVETEPQYKTRHFMLHRADSSCTDFSWRACITPPVHEDDCKKAMRAAISSQVIAFRHAQFSAVPSQFCALCGVALSRQAEIDHAAPKFEELAQAYADAVGGWQAVTLESSAEGQIGRTLSAGDAYTWALFHKTKANLRLLCGPCNRKKR